MTDNPYAGPGSTAPAFHSNASGDLEVPSTQVRISQIILIGLLWGLLFYIGFVLSNADELTLDIAVLTPAAVVTGGLHLLGAAVIPRILTRILAGKLRGGIAAGDRKGGLGVQRWAEIYQTQMIATAAILEGLAFYSTFLFSQDYNAIYLIVGIGATLLIASLFPTKGRIAAWIRRHRPLDVAV